MSKARTNDTLLKNWNVVTLENLFFEKGKSMKTNREELCEIPLILSPVQKTLQPEIEILDIRPTKPEAEPEKIYFCIRDPRPAKPNKPIPDLFQELKKQAIRDLVSWKKAFQARPCSDEIMREYPVFPDNL